MAHPLVTNVKVDGCDVPIMRPSKWGNPFYAGSREENVRRHREWFLAQPEMVAMAKRELRGKRLGCVCAPRDCHGDIIAEVANS